VLGEAYLLPGELHDKAGKVQEARQLFERALKVKALPDPTRIRIASLQGTCPPSEAKQ
jgi:hypothetical protein